MSYPSGVKNLDHLFKGFTFAKLLCTAMGAKGAYMSLKHIYSDESFVSMGGWTGPHPEEKSMATYAADAKVAELVYAGESEGFSMTPIKSFIKTLGWMGGVRETELIVGVSEWAEEHDHLLAVITLHALQWDTFLHHAGMRVTASEYARVAAKTADDPIELPAEDHLRIYNRVLNKTVIPIGKYYKEVQYYADEPKLSSRHWDLYVPNGAEHLLNYVGNAFGVEPEYWKDAGPDDPIGAVWVSDKKGNRLGVMARNTWWDPMNRLH